MHQRFAILHHTVGQELDRTDQSHWDWLFEVGDSLRTWASPVIESWIEIQVPCQPLADHRRQYLDYEGPLGGGRGSVSRVASGIYTTIDQSDERFEVQIQWTLNTAAGPLPRTAEALFQRMVVQPDSLRADQRGRWSLRLSPGW